MSVEASFVQVAPDSTGKLIDNVHLDTGVDDAGVERQVTAQGDPEDPDARMRVRAGRPLADDHGGVTREALPTFDTGMVTVPDDLDDVPGVDADEDVWVSRIIICNRTTDDQTFTLTNGAGDAYFQDYPLQPNMTLPPFDLGRAKITGLKWKAGAANAVGCHIVGEK